MRKMMPLMLGSLLFLGVAACSNSADSEGMGSNQEQRDGSSDSMADDGQQMSGNLASEVSEALSTNLPGSRLTVQASAGVVTIGGTVPSQEQFDKIEALAMGVKGVESVTNNAEVGPG